MAFVTNPKEANLVIGILGWFEGVGFLIGALMGTLPERAAVVGSMIAMAVGTLGFLRWTLLRKR